MSTAEGQNGAILAVPGLPRGKKGAFQGQYYGLQVVSTAPLEVRATRSTD